jgi:hypothetical protein
VTFPVAALLLQRPLPFRPWHAVFVVAFVLFFAGAEFGTHRLRKAGDVLGEAIGRYEFESAATESDLDEAGRRASEVLSGKSGRGEPAP